MGIAALLEGRGGFAMLRQKQAVTRARFSELSALTIDGSGQLLHDGVAVRFTNVWAPKTVHFSAYAFPIPDEANAYVRLGPFTINDAFRRNDVGDTILQFYTVERTPKHE